MFFRDITRYLENISCEIETSVAKKEAYVSSLLDSRNDQDTREIAEDDLAQAKALASAFFILRDNFISEVKEIDYDDLDKNIVTVSKCISILEDYLSENINTELGNRNTISSEESQREEQLGNRAIAKLYESAQEWVAGLSSYQKQAVTAYTSEVNNCYGNINRVLRGQETNFQNNNGNTSETLHSALDQARINEGITSYRYINSAEYDWIASRTDEQLVGTVFVDRGFVSTSLDPEIPIFRNRDTLLRIHMPQGTRAANIESLSAMGPCEREVLMDRGQVFRITRVSRQGRRRIIDVETSVL